MKTPISYYGGKQNLTKEILKLIPSHLQYVEPFFGGGAIFFAKPQSKAETINDQLNCVVNFYEVLKTNFDELSEKIQMTLHAEYYHKISKEILKSDSGSSVEKAWAFWVQTNMSFNGQIYASFAFDNSNKSSKKIYNKRKEFTHALSNRLKYTTIFCRDAIDIIKLKDTKDTFFYVDPPYTSADQGHYKGYTTENFTELLDTLANIKGKFLLSSYPEEILLKFAKINDWKIKQIIQFISADKRNNGAKKIECLTMNYKHSYQMNLFL